MTNFGIITGNKGKFSDVLESKLQNFQKDSDYYVYRENSGRMRKKHYVILSEKIAESLKEIDWKNLEGFRSVEVGEEDGPGPAEGESIKFVVEQVVDEWLDYYEITKPGAYVKHSLRDIGLGDHPNTNQLSIEFEERKKDYDLSNGVYRASWQFDKDGLLKKENIYRPNSNQSGTVNLNLEKKVSVLKKHCSNCRGKEYPENASFCEGCGKVLISLSPKIREITDQEAQQIKQEQGFLFFQTWKGLIPVFLLGVLGSLLIWKLIKNKKNKK